MGQRGPSPAIGPSVPTALALSGLVGLLGVGPGSVWGGTVYTANEVSNTVSVIDTGKNAVIATIPLGDEDHHRPLYHGIIDAHGANLSPDGKLLAVTGRGSSNVIFIDTQTRKVVGDVLVGREPHVPTFTPDGREVWVTVRGRDFIAIIDAVTLRVSMEIPTLNGPSMVWFSRNGARAYVGSQKEAGLSVIETATRKLLALVPVPGPFSPFLKASPDGKEIWLTHKTIDKVSVIDAETFRVLNVIDVGPRPNHVEFVTKDGKTLVYVTVGKTNLPPEERGGENIWVIDEETRGIVKTFSTGGKEAHGIWASADGSRLYVGHEVSSDVAVIDVATDAIVTRIPVGKRPIDVVFQP